MNWPVDLNDQRVQAALQWSCDICGAPKGEPCHKRDGIFQDLAGRVIHIGRLVDRRRK